MTVASPDAIGDAARSALGTVMDPELDRSLVELGFARALARPDGHVTVELRLPTYWCAPNFVFLMAQDARDAVKGAGTSNCRGATKSSRGYIGHFTSAPLEQQHSSEIDSPAGLPACDRGV